MRNEPTNLVRYEPPFAKPISDELRNEIEDLDAPELPAEAWAKGLRFHDVYRQLKKSVLLDEDILAWLKSGGSGGRERANQILRAYMVAEQAAGEERT